MTIILSKTTSMPQQRTWDNEYKNPEHLLHLNSKPQKGTLKFLKFMKKQGVDIAKQTVIDIGCGNGRNGNELAARGATVTGMDISPRAIELTKADAREKRVQATYVVHDIGLPWPFDDNAFTLALDVTSSNSLLAKEREVYLAELARTLEPGGWLYLKTLCLDGDKNAKELIKRSPGPEEHTYVLPGLGLTEHVFSETELRNLYEPYFKITKLEKKDSYTSMHGKSFKRRFWVGYLERLP